MGLLREFTEIIRHLPDSADLDNVLDFSALHTSLVPWWIIPETRYANPSRKKALRPDVNCWVDATLVLSPKVYRLLKDTFADMGGLLPVKVDCETHYVLTALLGVRSMRRAVNSMMKKACRLA